ncbi:unnamed protein product [Parnassius apollo]|uniref:(apollo) hypothetical protein n=1 Tax=Parnassius apollo TaxID=110799 RepID=A0A8S3W9Z7_PARAO|nr:unnamed protein product [Parnassius apollo]
MASNTKLCAGCLNKITNKDFVTCSLCKDIYDTVCANISHQRLMMLEKDKKEKWICPGCRNKERKSGNSNTPIQSRTDPRDCGDSLQEISTPNSDYITQRKKPQLPSNQKVSSPTQPRDESLMLTIRSEIKSSMGNFLNQTIEESSIKMDLRTIKEELSSLKDIKSGLEFLSAEYDRMKKELKTSKEHIKSLSAENSNLHTKVNELSNRLILLEQHSRETNIEVNGVPENKAANAEGFLNPLDYVSVGEGHEGVSAEIQTASPEGVSPEIQKDSCEQRHDYKKMGTYTSRAYQLERGNESDPTIKEFLLFLENRALALENAEPTTAIKTHYKPVVNVATPADPSCAYCAAPRATASSSATCFKAY